MNTPSFIHLSLHSEFAICDSIVRLDALCQKAIDYGMPAVGVTDLCNLFATVAFFKKAMAKGIQPIIGAEIWIESPIESLGCTKVLLLCQNNTGYHNLIELITQCYQVGKRLQIPLAKYKWLKERSQGLIAILKSYESDVAQLLARDQKDKANKCLSAWQTWFPERLYFGLTRYQRQAHLETQLLTLCQTLQCPVVAIHDVLFIDAEDYEAHEARVCVQQGATLSQSNRLSFHPQQYFKSPKEMLELFADIPESTQNTVEIAKRCSFFLNLGNPALPRFPVPDGETENSYIANLSKSGLEERLSLKFKLQAIKPEQQKTIQAHYLERLETELSVIIKMGFPGYFLIVADFIQWAKNHDIPVGPGRGSGAGSLVAYALSITDIDPIDYELLFERFLNPERVSMPDFDVDFCMDKRDDVIEYVAERYGRNCVSQIATFGTMAAKAVVRDVGRVLGHPYGFVDQIAKLIPFEIGMTLDKALQDEEMLKTRYDKEEEVRVLIDLAKKLEGITRNVGKHAGGVVIAPSALSDFTPLYCEENSEQTVTQFDKDDAETVGLVKFDFLGLRTLTIIHWAVKNANKALARQDKPGIKINEIALDDKKTFHLLKKCQTTAVFQLESTGMKELIKRLSPDQFEEIIALVALFRPGPLQSGMVDDFINRKHGRAEVAYPHEKIAPILKPTYGVILYQEQVMQIAQVLAGYSLGQADLLRRAMGKKKPEEMAKQRAAFVEGATERGVQLETAESIFDLMEKFAGYGFNKSHSAAYALVAYQTAWLKAHFPAGFMAAVLSADLNHTDKIVKFIDECKQLKIKLIPPDINQCNYYFTVNEKDNILYGLGAIKGVGESAVREILHAREQGPFRDLFELCMRVDIKKVPKRTLEPLIKAGAFDCFGVNRGVLLANLADAVKEAENQLKASLVGQGNLFANTQIANEAQSTPYHDSKSYHWSVSQRLQFEKECLGWYSSGHPIQVVAKELKQFGINPIRQMINKQSGKQTIAGIITNIRTMLTKKGDRMAFITLDDNSANVEIAVFADAFAANREHLEKDKLVVIETEITFDKFRQAPKIRAHACHSLDALRARKAKYLKIAFKETNCTSNSIVALKTLLEKEPKGSCHVVIHYHKTDCQAELACHAKWNIEYSKAFIEKIRQQLKQIELVDVVY